MQSGELLPHLFRTEYRKIVSVLAKRFGFDQLETAEDIASDTFLTATQSWGIEGIPENPTAWLYNVAKNKAKNFLHRKTLFDTKISAVVKEQAHGPHEYEIDLSPQNINDSQLKMMFAICHPSLPPEGQIGLSLRILCGFGVEEIADAFLTTKEVINKRLFRAKEKLREENVNLEFVESDVDERLVTVLTTLYLLFNEGYHSLSQSKTLRKELCLEALRLCTMLVENEITNKPQVNALLSLMCFHTSRFDSRISNDGEIILYEDQDASLWNPDFISKGAYFLNRAATGAHISKYHLEAGIAYWNTRQSDTEEKWENILQLYNKLLQLEYSPIAALNRTYALAKARSKKAALAEAEKLSLRDNPFYFALLGELYTGIDNAKARLNYEKTIDMVKTEPIRRAIQKKIEKLNA